MLIRFLADGVVETQLFFPNGWLIIEISIGFYDHVFGLIQKPIINGKEQIRDYDFVFGTNEDTFIFHFTQQRVCFQTKGRKLTQVRD